MRTTHSVGRNGERRSDCIEDEPAQCADTQFAKEEAPQQIPFGVSRSGAESTEQASPFGDGPWSAGPGELGEGVVNVEHRQRRRTPVG